MDWQRLRKSPNIAIVGSTSLLGKELQEMLENRGRSIGRLTLLETEEYAGLLQEFAGEIQITQVISPDAFDDVDIAFFTCSPEIMQSYVASGAKFPDLTIDLTQAGREGMVVLWGRGGADRTPHDISAARALKGQLYFVNPHPAAIVIGRLLSALHKKFVVNSAAITVLQPASERGNPGVDELQEQTVNLLNFQEFETKVFNAQLAFNILSGQEASARIEARIVQQLDEILGKTFPKPMITAVQAPVFHSHAFSMFIQLLDAPGAEEVSAHLRSNPRFLTAAPTGGPSPVSVVGTDTIHIGRVHRVNQDNTFALWVVADNLRLAASNALETADFVVVAQALQA